MAGGDWIGTELEKASRSDGVHARSLLDDVRFGDSGTMTATMTIAIAMRAQRKQMWKNCDESKSGLTIVGVGEIK